MKTLAFSDSHINQKSLKELNEIFKEIISYKADNLVIIGDYFDSKKAGAEEILFATKWMDKFLSVYPTVYMVRGNHEEISEDLSLLDYFKYLGVQVLNELELGGCYFGHFFTEKSNYVIRQYNKWNKKHSYIEDKPKVLLGHQHGFQELQEGQYHLGSCRYVTFAEVGEDKRIALIEEDITFIPLKSPIKAYNVINISELKEIPFNSKVRFIFKDFNYFKENINLLKEIKDRYYEFKIKLDFEKKTFKREDSNAKSFKEILSSWIDKIEDEDIKKELLDATK